MESDEPALLPQISLMLQPEGLRRSGKLVSVRGMLRRVLLYCYKQEADVSDFRGNNNFLFSGEIIATNNNYFKEFQSTIEKNYCK